MPGQRQYHRVPFETVAVVIHAGHNHSCDLVDIGLCGALMRVPAGLPLEPGDRCALSISLPMTDLTLEFDAELVRCDGADYGFRFIGEDDATLAHLRRLLELNYGDSRQIDSEILHWLKS